MSAIPYCVEITELGGVKLPRTVRVFDCRIPDSEMFGYVTPWGTKPIGGERAEIVLGLRGEGRWDAATPIRMSGYMDLRSDSDYARAKLAEVAREFARHARQYRSWYRRAQANPSSDGGRVHYLAVAFALCNYGWSMIADRRVYAVSPL